MIVHYLREWKKRRRQERDQEPEETETNHARFLKIAATIAAAVNKTVNAQPAQKRASLIVVKAFRS